MRESQVEAINPTEQLNQQRDVTRRLVHRLAIVKHRLGDELRLVVVQDALQGTELERRGYSADDIETLKAAGVV